MILSATKTKSMLVTSKRLHSGLVDCKLEITASGTQIEQVHTKKLLGLVLDDQLTFDEHVNQLCKKLAQRIGVLKQIRSCLPIRQGKQFYNVMFKSVTLYGSTVWSSSSKNNIERIFKQQKRVARVIMHASKEDRTVELFRKLNWIPYYD